MDIPGKRGKRRGEASDLARFSMAGLLVLSLFLPALASGAPLHPPSADARIEPAGPAPSERDEIPVGRGPRDSEPAAEDPIGVGDLLWWCLAYVLIFSLRLYRRASGQAR